MKNIFQPEDFTGLSLSLNPEETVARQANSKLNNLIESWPKAYGYRDPAGYYVMSSSKTSITATHTSRLAFIEEITKEPCKHIAGSVSIVNGEIKTKCLYCRVQLKATWNEEK